jgi:hypothetical protein
MLRRFMCFFNWARRNVHIELCVAEDWYIQYVRRNVHIELCVASHCRVSMTVLNPLCFMAVLSFETTN